MTFTIEFGWWLLPASFTLTSIIGYLLWQFLQKPSQHGAVDTLFSLIIVLILCVLNLAAWFVFVLETML